MLYRQCTELHTPEGLLGPRRADSTVVCVVPVN